MEALHPEHQIVQCLTLLLCPLLLLLVLQQSLRIERRREEGMERLRDSYARYHALVEATTEGTLLVIDGRLRYANPTFLELLGYTTGPEERPSR